MKITFLGAGSTVFVKNLLGDCLLIEDIDSFEVALYDIDAERLKESQLIITALNNRYGGKMKIEAYTDIKKALTGANYVINAIQVGGYEPCTVTDFEIPRKYGLRQTIGDTLGIGGIFRALRTIPVLEFFAREISKYCPDALFLNYVNPMAMLTGYLLTHTGVKSVGLCHSVQVCAHEIFWSLGMEERAVDCRVKIAGINHMSWLLSITDAKGKDLYPEIKRLSKEKWDSERIQHDRVRHTIMHEFGYYVTESSEHNAEYHPYFIKNAYPELIDKYFVRLDEYPKRCIQQIADWKIQKEKLLKQHDLEHSKTKEYTSAIIQAMEGFGTASIHGNVLNEGLITNLPKECTVEVPIMVNRHGLQPVRVGDLPVQCAALNRTNINVQLLTMEAARTGLKKYIYMAAMLDPHTASELPIDKIKAMCDELIEAHGDWLPKFV